MDDKIVNSDSIKLSIGSKVIFNNKINIISIISKSIECLYKSILFNLEISVAFTYELKQFIDKYIIDKVNELQSKVYNKDILLNRKDEILSKDVYCSVIDMYVISHYLKINLIIVDEKMIIQNIIGDNEEIIGNNLYFLEKDDHIEPIVQQSFINRNSELKNKAQNLLKVLIALYEKNKIILLDVENKEDDLTKTIVENDNLNLNLFIDNKPKIEYRIINRKEFNKLYQSGNVINYDLLNAYLLTKQSSYTKLFFEREKKENKDDK